MQSRASANAPKFRPDLELRPAPAVALWRNPLLLAGLATAALLVVAGFWIHHATEQALRDKLREGLHTVSATSAAALTFWIDIVLNSARDWSELPDVRAATQRLAVLATGSAKPFDDLLAAPEQTELLATLIRSWLEVHQQLRKITIYLESGPYPRSRKPSHLSLAASS